MRILVDVTPLLLRGAGVKTYTYGWLQHLMEQAGNDKILTYPHVERLMALDHEQSMFGADIFHASRCSTIRHAGPN